MYRCEILIPDYDISLGTEDKKGCLKERAHNDNHLTLLNNGTFIEWEDVSPYDDEGRPVMDKEAFDYREVSTKEAVGILDKHYKNKIPFGVMKILNPD